jgi:hypothetical protein
MKCVLIFYLKARLESKEHRRMEKYDKDPSMPDDDSSHTYCCIKTGAGSNYNIAAVSDHELHCTKTETDIDTYMADFNNPTSDTKAGTVTIGLDTKPAVVCIKSEPQDDAPMQCEPHNTIQSEAEKTVIDWAVIMYTVSHDNQSSIQIDSTHSTTFKGVCHKHENIYSEDNTHPSTSSLNAAD